MADTGAAHTQSATTAPVSTTEGTGFSHYAPDGTTAPNTETVPGYAGSSANGSHHVTDEKSRHVAHHGPSSARSLPARITRILLWISLSLLIVDAAVEVGLAGNSLRRLRALDTSSTRYLISSGGTSLYLYALPVYFDFDVLRVALSAGAVALGLVGLGGILAIKLRGSPSFATSLYSKIWYHIWLVSVLLSTLLSFASIIYTFVIRNKTAGNRITLGNVSRLSNANVRYNAGYWSPITWYNQLRTLRLVWELDRNEVAQDFNLIVGWMYNQYPLFILGLAVLFFAIVDGVISRKLARQRRTEKEGYAAQ